MCTLASPVTDLIDSVVDAWIAQGRAFTAFEVSLEVQKQLPQNGLAFLHHREMVDYYRDGLCGPLQSALNTGTYLATLRTMPNGQQANVYYPPSYDVSRYQPLPTANRRTRTPAAAPATPAPTNGNGIFQAPAAPAAPTDGSLLVEVNKSGELWISRRAVAAAGWGPGSVVEFSRKPDLSGVVAEAIGQSGSVSHSVEAYGNLRLYPKDRSLLALTGSRFKLSVSPGRMEIVPA